MFCSCSCCVVVVVVVVVVVIVVVVVVAAVVVVLLLLLVVVVVVVVFAVVVVVVIFLRVSVHCLQDAIPSTEAWCWPQKALTRCDFLPSAEWQIEQRPNKRE